MQIGGTQKISDNFKKAEVIVKTVEQYPNYYKIEFINGNTDLLQMLDEKDNVKIHCNLRGRLYTKDTGENEVFMSLVGWKIEGV